MLSVRSILMVRLVDECLPGAHCPRLRSGHRTLGAGPRSPGPVPIQALRAVPSIWFKQASFLAPARR